MKTIETFVIISGLAVVLYLVLEAVKEVNHFFSALNMALGG